MAELSFGWREGPGKGKEYPVAANQPFHRRGGGFVFIDANGRAALCHAWDEDTRRIFGWLEKAKDTSGYDVWMSSSTAGADSAFVITGYEDRFEIPAYEANASISATSIGKNARIATYTATRQGTNGYHSKQRAELTTVATTPELMIYDVDLTNKTLLVGIHPDAIRTRK